MISSWTAAIRYSFHIVSLKFIRDECSIITVSIVDVTFGYSYHGTETCMHAVSLSLFQGFSHNNII